MDLENGARGFRVTNPSPMLRATLDASLEASFDPFVIFFISKTRFG